MNLCIPSADTQGTLRLDGTHQKSETKQAEAVSPGDRLNRQPVLGMAMELREDEILKHILVHYLSKWSPGSPSAKELLALGFVYKLIWAVVRPGWVELWSGKSFGDDLRWRKALLTVASCFVQ